MKKVLVLDRDYKYNYLKSNKFEIICATLDIRLKEKYLEEGLNVVGCFTEEYKSLPIAEFPSNYLIHSFDSDRFLGRYSYNKRLEILGKEITFWARILDEYKPTCIVNEIVTFEWMEVLYIEAMKRGIPYYNAALLLTFSPYDLWNKNRPFNNRLTKKEWESIKPTEDCYDKADIYITRMLNKQQIPYYIKNKQPNTMFRLFSAIRNVMAAYKRSCFIRIQNREFLYEDHINEYKECLKMAIGSLFYNYDKYPEEGIEYIFFPMHFEPEAALTYRGDCYEDQCMIICRTAHALSCRQKLLVKEHPQQPGKLLTKKYRDLKKTYPNLVYLPARISALDIYKNIKALVTITGSAGFECLIFGKPVIIMGDIYYEDIPGATPCRDFTKLKEILHNESYNRPNPSTIRDYIAKLESAMSIIHTTVQKNNPYDDYMEQMIHDIELFVSGKDNELNYVF